MLRTESSGAGAATAPGAAWTVSAASVMWALSPTKFVMPGLVPGIHVFCRAEVRRGWPGHLARRRASRFRPAMTSSSERSPPEPFRLARQFDGLDLLELDGALGHQIVQIAVGGAGDFRAIEVDLHRAAMVL